MQASSEVYDTSGAQLRAVVASAGAAIGPLVHDADVGAGVQISVDLLAPGRWHRVTARSETHAQPVLDAVLAETGQPWLRVAVVDALDRWVHLPLIQGLVDAERATARQRAAEALPPGPARDAVIGDALRVARRGAAEFAHHVRGLRLSPSGGGGLLAAVHELVESYAALTAVVGRDRALAAVQRAWESRDGAGAAVAAGRPRQRGRAPASGSPLDPRLVRARVLALSGDPVVGEVEVSPGGRDEALVRVPVFAPSADSDIVDRLLVRLVDRRSSVPLAHGVLTVRRRGPRRYLHGVVPLRGSDLRAVRADVYDALSPPPPVPAAPGLHEVRRAAVFLAEWRRLVALARVAPGAATAARLRALARTVRSGDSASPAFPGGPSPAELDALAERADVVNSLREAGADVASIPGPLGSAQGVGRLTVAELLSAHAEGAT